MSERADCQRRFQAAVRVIQSLPRTGSYKPSYEVMLRFYGLYKQALCGPCVTSRPAFWDPVARYKWDAWRQLGEMSRETAMAAYVEEMKNVAQEVINIIRIDEKTASFFDYFEPLYHVIHDMPKPPEALLSLRSDVNARGRIDGLAEHKETTGELALQRENMESFGEDRPEIIETPASEGQGPTSDSESELFCDSLEQPDSVKVTQMGTGHGGERAEDEDGSATRSRRTTGGGGTQQGWSGSSGDRARRSARRTGQMTAGSGSGRGGGDHSGNGPDGTQDGPVQEKIILALRRLRQDMQSVMERLEVVEALATANAQNSQWRAHLQLTAAETEVKHVTSLMKE